MIKFCSILQERMFVYEGFSEYIQKVADAYVRAPSYDSQAVMHWKALVEDDKRLGQRLLSKIKVEWVSGQPYSNYEELQNDVKKNHHLSISDDHLEHPVFSRDENLIFRAVHDYYAHVLGNHPFGAKGEFEAYNLGLKLHSKQAIPALFTEAIGQTSVVVTTGKFPEQKVVLLPMFDYYNVGRLSEMYSRFK